MYKYLLLVAISFVISSCQRAGGYRDMAEIRNAERAIRRVRNALEEYWVDHRRYPEEGVDLRSVLAPYFTRTRIRQSDDAPLHIAVITNARDQLTSISRLLESVKREVVPRLDCLKREEILLHTGRIEELILSYSQELEGDVPPSLDVNTEKEFESMISIVERLNPDSLALKVDQRLIEKSDEVIMLTQELSDRLKGLPLDSVKIAAMVEKAEGIASTFMVYKATLKGEELRDARIVIPDRELSDIERMLKPTDFGAIQAINNIRQAISAYNLLEREKDGISFLLKGIKSLERARGLLVSYERKARREVKGSAKISLANAALFEMADALQRYRSQFGRYPEDKAAIKPVIHHYFIEVTMGGDTIDRYEEKLSYLREFPSYEVTETGFVLRGRVADDAGTPIFCRAEIISDWDEVVAAFAEGPTYMTKDPSITYFLTARARDSKRTLVSDRPPIRQ